MSYHFKLEVIFWSDREYSIYVPEYLKIVKSDNRDYCSKTVYMSKKYYSYSAMMEDYNTLEMPILDTTPTFYNDNEPIPYCECMTGVI